MSTPRMLGQVSEYDADKGYGRIRDADDTQYFVHFRDLHKVDVLEPGQSVEFVAVLHRKGNIAREVTVV